MSVGMHTVTVRVPVDLRVRVAAMCSATGSTFQAFVLDALRRELARRHVQISPAQRLAYDGLLATIREAGS